MFTGIVYILFIHLCVVVAYIYILSKMSEIEEPNSMFLCLLNEGNFIEGNRRGTSANINKGSEK